MSLLYKDYQCSAVDDAVLCSLYYWSRVESVKAMRMSLCGDSRILGLLDLVYSGNWLCSEYFQAVIAGYKETAVEISYPVEFGWRRACQASWTERNIRLCCATNEYHAETSRHLSTEMGRRLGKAV